MPEEWTDEQQKILAHNIESDGRVLAGPGTGKSTTIRFLATLLTATRRLAELIEKQGRTGPLIFVIVETEITAADGEKILSERYTRILR